MKTLARLVALLFAATLLSAPLPAAAQQKQDTMKKSAAKTGEDAKKAPAPGPK